MMSKSQQVNFEPEERNIGLIGCGKMGSAMAMGWINSHDKYEITIVDPMGVPEGFHSLMNQDVDSETVINAYDAVEDLGYTDLIFDAVVIAVKPQSLDQVCAELRTHITSSSLIISIAAGKSLESIAEHFEPDQPIVRAMPNTPAAIGKGITVATANMNAEDKHYELVADLLKSTGALEWVPSETVFNAVTALSGSGPAYVFLLMEAMKEAGISLGISEELADKLARKTVLGSGALAEHEAGSSPEELRKNVTSPGGTTEAALNVLCENDALKKLVDNAMKAAEKRGEELDK